MFTIQISKWKSIVRGIVFVIGVGKKLMTKIFPIILITLDIGAAVVYLCHGDNLKAGYWLSAASISYFALQM